MSPEDASLCFFAAQLDLCGPENRCLVGLTASEDEITVHFREWFAVMEEEQPGLSMTTTWDRVRQAYRELQARRFGPGILLVQ